MTRIRPERIKQGNASNGQVLAYDSTLGQWVGTTIGSGFNNGQSISVSNIVITGSATANGSTGTAGQVLTSSGTGLYWDTAANASQLAATAFSNAIATAASDATTKAATAYSNAVATAASDATTKAATAYSNAVSYAASNTYVNNTFAPKASPTFTGTVTMPTVSANGSVGTAGQVLTTNGTGTYWSTVNVVDNAPAAYSNAVTYTNTIAATTYANATAYATTRAATAFSNAVATAAADATNKAATAFSNAVATAATDATNKAATAYSNAIAYAVSNSYVNTTFAPKANPTFTGTVTIPTISANSSVGSIGQVLTSNGTGVFWSSPGYVISANSFVEGIFTANGSTRSVVSATANGVIDLSKSNYYTSPTASLQFTNPPASGILCAFTIKLNVYSNTSLNVINNNVLWTNGVVPTVNGNRTTFLHFMTDDGGLSYYGTLVSEHY